MVKNHTFGTEMQYNAPLSPLSVVFCDRKFSFLSHDTVHVLIGDSSDRLSSSKPIMITQA